jgi:hypothetical protein
MALNANALVSLAEAATALGLLTPKDDAITEPLVNQASQLAESTYCKRVLKKRTYTNLRLVGPMSQKLFAPTWPIDTAATATISISVGGAVRRCGSRRRTAIRPSSTCSRFRNTSPAIRAGARAA